MFFPRTLSWKLVHMEEAFCAGKLPAISATNPIYSPPELRRAKQEGLLHLQMDPSADIWSFGVMSFELLTGVALSYFKTVFKFSRIQGKEFEDDVTVCDYLAELFQSSYEEARSAFNLTRNAVDFLRKTLCCDRTKRPSAEELLSHDLLRHLRGSTETAPQMNEVCFLLSDVTCLKIMNRSTQAVLR